MARIRIFPPIRAIFYKNLGLAQILYVVLNFAFLRISPAPLRLSSMTAFLLLR